MADRELRRTFTAIIERDAKGRVSVAVPFDPDEAWGVKARHHVVGTVGPRRVRVALDGTRRLGIGGPVVGLPTGERVEVTLEPEGPQLDGLAPDLVAALEARPEARAFFESLATFYRKGYLRWVDATKRRPDVRAARIAELVELLAAGHKERPS